MSVFSNNRFLKRVNPEIVRAKDDSGSSLNHPEIQKLMRQMVDLDIADNLKLWVHNGLVKTRTSGSDTFVSKAYDISGEENDGVQATEASQHKLASDSFKMVAPSSGRVGYPITDNADIRFVNNFSISIWIKNDTIPTTSNTYFISDWDTPNNNRRWALMHPANLQYFRFFGSPDGSSVNNYNHATNFDSSNGSWTHYVISIGSDNLTWYINGSFSREFLEQSNIPFNSYSGSQITIGRSGFQHDMYINDIRIYNKALSATEVSAIHNQSKGFYGIT